MDSVCTRAVLTVIVKKPVVPDITFATATVAMQRVFSAFQGSQMSNNIEYFSVSIYCTQPVVQMRHET